MRKTLLLLLSLPIWLSAYAVELSGTHIQSFINHDIYQYATLSITAEGNTVTISNMFHFNQPIAGKYDEAAQTLTFSAGQLIDESTDGTKHYLYTYTVDESNKVVIDKTSDIVFTVKEGNTYNTYSSEQNMIAIDEAESSYAIFTKVSYRNYQNATLTTELVDRQQSDVIGTEEYPVYVDMVGEGQYLIRNFDQRSRFYVYTHRDGTISTIYQDYPAFYNSKLKNYYYPVAFVNDEIEGAEGSGTLEDPYNIAGALLFTRSLQDDVQSENDVYIKGTISSIEEEFGGFGKATFYITDQDRNYTFYVYRTLFLNNKKWKDGDTQIKVGDEVIICGKVMNFKGRTPETVANLSYIYQLNDEISTGTGGTTVEAAGSGALEDPYNVTAAINAVSGLTWTSNTEYDKTDDVYVKGKISRISNKGTYGESGTFGNASFYISDDGSQDNELFCFRILYLGNEKYTSGTDIKVGDEVIICGKLMNYRGNTPETVAGEAYLYALNPGGSVSSSAKAYKRKTDDMTIYGTFEGNILRINSAWAYYMDNRNNENVDEEYRKNWINGNIHKNTVITLDAGRFLMPHVTHEVTTTELLMTTKDNFLTAYQDGWMWSGDTSDDTNINETTNKQSTIEPGTDNLITLTTFPGLGIKNHGNAAKNVYMRVKGISALKFYVTSNSSDMRTAIVTATPAEGDAVTKEVASTSQGAVGTLEGLDAEKTYTVEFYTEAKDMTLYAVQLISATTGISIVESRESRVESYYDLMGRRVGKDYKGIVIVNGKKLVVK